MAERLYYSKEPDDMPQETLNEMRNQLKAISPSTIINQAFQTSYNLRQYNYSFKKKDELLEYTKTQILNNFMDNLKGKSLKEIKAKFNKKIEDYQAGVQVIIEKTKKEKMQCRSQYNSLLEKNTSLQDENAKIYQQYFTLEKGLKHSEEEIHKLQARFNLFIEFKVLFEELFKEFPNLSPNEIIKDIRNRRQEGSQLLLEYNTVLNNNNILQKENSSLVSKSKRQLQDITRKAFEIQSEYKIKEDASERKIVQLENDLSRYKQYKEETIVMHKMLYSIYNLLIETLRLNKDMKLNEELDIKEIDFTVDMLNTEEIIRYVKVMIQSLHHSSTEKLLLETIAYANMMVRTFMKDKINKKFDPVDIFKEIKKLIVTKHEKITQLEHCMLIEKEKNALLVKNIKTNLKMIETLKRKNEALIDKAFKKNTHSRNIDKSKTSFEHKDEIYCVNKTEIKKEKEMSKTIDQRLTANMISSKPFSFSQSSYRGHKKKILKKQNDRQSLYQSKSKTEALKEKTKVIKKYNQLNTNKIISPKEIMNESSLSSSDNNIVTIKKEELERFKDIKTVPNKDKLVKSHGFQATIKHLSDFKEFIDHTNRIMFYKAKIQKKKVSKLDNFNKRIEHRFIKQLSFDNLTKQMKIEESLTGENQIKERLLMNIKRIVNTIKASNK